VAWNPNYPDMEIGLAWYGNIPDVWEANAYFMVGGPVRKTLGIASIIHTTQVLLAWSRKGPRRCKPATNTD